MNNLLEYDKYDPKEEYKEDSRRDLDLAKIKKSQEYENILGLGFKDITSDQQAGNNTIKFERKKQPEERGYGNVFYTIHPTGVVKRYNPKKDTEMSEGQGNAIKSFKGHFRTSKAYIKGLKYLYEYLVRKEKREDYR